MPKEIIDKHICPKFPLIKNEPILDKDKIIWSVIEFYSDGSYSLTDDKPTCEEIDIAYQNIITVKTRGKNE